MTSNFYIKKRQELTDKIENNSLVILHSNYQTFKSADSIYEFHVNNNFYYLTGLKQDNIILVLGKINGNHFEHLFIDENDPILVKWVGAKYTKEEASELSGIEEKNISYTTGFDKYVEMLIQPSRYSDALLDKIYLDLERRDLPLYDTFGLKYAKYLQENFPYVVIKNIYPFIINMRMYKEAEEVEEIRKSIESTRRAIYNIFSHHHLLKNEAEAVAYHDFVLTCEHKKTSFGTIMASGKNACILHYEDNNSDIEKDSLMLMDLGSSTNCYASDISRTFPVSGKFTDRQKEIYQAVLDVNKACIKYAKDGMTWKELNDYAKELLAEALIRLNVMKEKSSLGEYYFHSIGHSLGLDVHDPNIASLGIQKGMVITIEPGLYIPEEGIGIRIEDDILITDGEAINLSESIIKEVEDLEKFMCERKN